MNDLETILQQIQDWEQGPINELFGSHYSGTANTTRRVMLYGPTQVGKTTLLMNLIGIRPELQDALDEILRGGEKLGNSSTSTAVIYTRWNQEDFGLLTGTVDSIPTQEPTHYTQAEFAAKISQFNHGNRSDNARQNKTSDILYYYIPQRFFSEDATNKGIQVIDLPGFGEKNEKMRKRADYIIDYFSRIVTGAIVVVKSEQIVSLQSDYKRFIDSVHQKRLAIAVSFGLATLNLRDGENQAIFQNYTSDRELAERISDHYTRLIREEYLPLPDTAEERIVFAMEHRGWLQNNHPQYLGAFDQSRCMLEERIASMKNRTSIESCEEMCDITNKYLEQRIVSLGEEAEEVQEELEKVKANTSQENLEQKVKAETKRVSELKTKIKQLTDEFQALEKSISATKGKRILTGGDVSCDVDTYHFDSLDERRTRLTKEMHEQIESWICPASSDMGNRVREKLIRTADNQIYGVDIADLIKKRDGFFIFKSFGDYSRAYVDEEMLELTGKIRSDLTRLLSKEREKHLSDPTQSLNLAQQELLRLQKGLVALTNKLKDLEDTLAEINESIAVTKEQTEKNLRNRDAVRAVFTRHYYAKMSDIDRQLAAADSGAKQAALLLVKGAIYVNMKPYVQEESK